MTVMNFNPPHHERDPLDKKLAKIASENIPELKDRKTLMALYSDDLDFFETSVWSLADALKAAYELGRKEGKK